MSPRFSEFPPIGRGAGEVLAVIEAAKVTGRLGVDFEFIPETKTITIVGVATRERATAAPAHPDLLAAIAAFPGVLVAYAGIGADKPQLDAAGYETPLDRWRDAMIRHWIVNPDLASVPKSSLGEDADDNHVMGFMNIWIATMMTHDLPRWKGGYRHSCGDRTACAGPNPPPCPEHDEAAYCAVDAFAGLVIDDSLIERMAELGIPESYYHWRVKLAAYCLRIQERGVAVDTKVIADLEETISSRKAHLFPSTEERYGKPRKNGTRPLLKKPRRVWHSPFNPNSPQAVCEWFAAHDIRLADRGKPTMGKLIILKELNKQLRIYGLKFDPETQELVGESSEEITFPTVATVVNGVETQVAPLDLLLRLVQKTFAGKGLDAWFDSKYIVMEGGVPTVHARFNVCGTSTSRLSSHRPNYTNIPKLGFGTEVRRAIKARAGKKLLKADYSQLEARACFYFAGENPDLLDGAFDNLTERGGQLLIDAAASRRSKPRDVSKRLVHAGDYLEGLSLRSPKELAQGNSPQERRAGALRVYDGGDLPLWTYRGKIVCFTGTNLADTLFDNHTYESRKKALDLQDLYFNAYPAIRAWQQRMTMELEIVREARLPSGHRVGLYGRITEDDIKYLLAIKGQGGGAVFVQEAMLRFAEHDDVMILQVHDEFVFEVPKEWSDDACKEFLMPMVEPSKLLTPITVPGQSRPFVCPAKVEAGPNWKDTIKLGEIRWKPTI